MKDKIYVVEGTHDEAVLQQVIPGIKTISVGGSQIKEDVLDFLVNNQDKFEMVLLLDPDYAGENIRKKLAKKLTNPTHIFFERSVSFSKNKKKIGIEHVNSEKIKELIKYEVHETHLSNDINTSVLYDLGLTGQANSKELRKVVTDHFKVGHCNAKILIQRLNWLGISTLDLKRVLDGTSS